MFVHLSSLWKWVLFYSLNDLGLLIDASKSAKEDEDDELDAFMNSMQSSANAKTVEALKKKIPGIELVRLFII